MIRKLAIVALATALLWTLGGTAIASGQTARYRRVVSSVSGPEAVAEAVKMLRGVEVGARATTLSLDVGGGVHEVRLDYGAVERDVTGSDRPVLLPLAVAGMAAGGAARLARFLLRFRRLRV